MSRFLVAASALTVSTLVQGANWTPTSPLIQIGNDCDIYFDSAASLEVTDNLYSAPTKTSATSWMVTPGFLLEYGKDSALTVTLSAKHTFVNFTDNALSDLEDGRDALSAGIRFADGGPLTLSLDSSYRVSARNDDLQMQGLGGLLGATLVRQANYSHAFRADYKLTEKLRVGLGYTNTFNQYLDPTQTGSSPTFVFNTNTLTELNTKSMPLSFDFQAFEKLSFGLVLQHDVTDYSAAPYFSQANTPRPALTHQQLLKDFAGLTARGQLSESGKLNGNIRVGYSRFSFDNAPKDKDLSYLVNLSHQLSERFSQSLTLSRDVTASSTNGQMAAKNYTYGLSYTASEDLTMNFSATKSDVFAGTSQIDSYVYNLGADYKYTNHLTFQAGYSFNDSKASVAASTYLSNTFTLSAAFRY
ncbi:MAG: hypothetical protein CK541_02015 [Opitutia bacterium]|nr:hypothetical protein [Opitutales bacterium]PHX80011.1 MAG: hypothetical protein CK541_02030 [Opitutae bacterium]PHX80060.1 MAG: hypothetical protein CK541_02015 [Opitutae bacterium]